MTIKIAVLAIVSAFVAVHPLAAQTGVVINEIMYAPISPEPEWIELYNTDTNAIDLTGWQLATATHTGTIPYGTLPGHGYLVFTKDSLTLISWRPGDYHIVAMPLPQLPNAGAILTLRDSSLQTIDSLAYLPSWGGSTGASLERRNVTKPANDPANWGGSTAPIIYSGTTSATPGAINSLAVPDSIPTDTAAPAKPLDLVINEIMFAPISPEPEWIELLNTTSDTINIGNWYIGVGTTLLKLEGFFTIAPDSLAILTKDPSSLSSLDGIPRSRIAQISLPALNNNGSVVALYDPTGNLIDSVSYDGSWIKHTGISIERIDPSKPGYTALNWASCEDSSGSTILRPNSVRKREHDVALISMNGLDEVDSSIILSIGNLGRDTSHNIKIRLQIDNFDTVIAIIPVFLPPDTTVQILVPFPQNFYGLFHGAAYLNDSLDENHSNDTIHFAIELPVPQDSLVINEVMFDPQPTSCEWLELYNRSGRWISLDSARLVTGEKRPGEYSHWVTPLLIAPDSFGAIAADSALFYQTYPA
ncbi:MAG TPA: lamin tail domain-containing protein, partial [Candidatus Kapabacteria bacterium]|nr:lamin tail domain-containing protein [Candidatus Kapabacteria bacterium]